MTAETPRMLAIDASGTGLSVAMGWGDAVLAAIEWSESRTAGERLLEWVDALTGSFGVPDRVTVGIGPGSFTGTRIAVTAAKTLAWAWGRPLHPASSLQALAASIANPPCTVVASSERRGDQVYLGVYFRGRDTAEPLVPDRRWTLPATPEVPLQSAYPVVVTGSLAADPTFVEGLGARAVTGACPARGLLRLAAWGASPVKEPHVVEPNYLRAALGATSAASPDPAARVK